MKCFTCWSCAWTYKRWRKWRWKKSWSNEIYADSEHIHAATHTHTLVLLSYVSSTYASIEFSEHTEYINVTPSSVTKCWMKTIDFIALTHRQTNWQMNIEKSIVRCECVCGARVCMCWMIKIAYTFINLIVYTLPKNKKWSKMYYVFIYWIYKFRTRSRFIHRALCYEGPNEIRTQYRRNFANCRERESGKPERELKENFGLLIII